MRYFMQGTMRYFGQTYTEDAVWRNRFPLNNINACWFLSLVHRLYLIWRYGKTRIAAV